MSECVYTRAECHHQGYKCSECPITDLVCDEFNDCLDLSYQQGKTDAIDELQTKLTDQWLLECLASADDTKTIRQIIAERLEQVKGVEQG